jgi:TonB family protein
MVAPAAMRCLRRPLFSLVRLGGLALGIALFAGPLAAQNLLYIQYNGKYALVRRALADKPYVVEDDKWVEVIGSHFLFKAGGEYRPILIETTNVDVAMQSQDLVNTGAGEMRNTDAMVADGRELNQHYVFSADLRSRTAIDDVFVMLAIESPKAGAGLILRGVGHLDANRPAHISISVPAGFDPAKMQITPHYFVGGPEALNTAMAPADLEKALDRMVAKKIAGVKMAEIKPFVGPALAYPAALLKTGAKGQATIAFKVGRRGEVEDPAVTAASDPAFGDAALATIRQWRFLPQIKDGSPVETSAELPFVFTPPS